VRSEGGCGGCDDAIKLISVSHEPQGLGLRARSIGSTRVLWTIYYDGARYDDVYGADIVASGAPLSTTDVRIIFRDATRKNHASSDEFRALART